MPGGPGIRMDGAVTTGNVVSRYYDSMLAKVIASAPTFRQSTQKMQRALSEFQVRGIKTNIPFLENVMRHPEFLSGEATTFFIEKHSRELFNFERHGSLRSSKLLSYLAGGEGTEQGTQGRTALEWGTSRPAVAHITLG